MTSVWVRGLILAGVVATAAWADDVEKVEKAVLDKWNDVKSLSATIDMTMSLPAGANKIDGTGSGTYEFLRHEGKSRYRLELTQLMRVQIKPQPKPGEDAGDAKPQEMKLEQKLVTVDDGEFVYQVSSQMGGKQAVKRKKDDVTASDLKLTFETLRRDYTLKVLPEEKVGDDDAFVIEATPKSAGARPSPVPGMPSSAKTVFHFSKKHGVMVKRTELTDKGDVLNAITFKDVKLNEKIDPDRFTPAKDENYRDMTAGGSAPPAPTPAPAPAPAPATQPAAKP